VSNEAQPQPPTRYFLSIGDGQSYGPYTLDELRGFVAEGRVRAGAMLLEMSTNEWIPVQRVLPDVGLPPTAPPAIGGVATVPNARRIRMGWALTVSVLTVLLATCVPVGIVAFLYARSANEKYARGDAAGGEAAERAYRRWMIASWIVVALALYFTYESYRMCASFVGQLG